MIVKEYRICMPMTVEEYRIGQLYMIARFSEEQSCKGSGVQVIVNEPCYDEKHGKGQYTEKRIYLNGRLPAWLGSFLPNIFYIIEKAWNYYPFTITEYACSFIPKFNVKIETTYKDDSGEEENALGLSEETLSKREVVQLDIAYDQLPEKYYVKEEDCRYFHSKKTNRGPLAENWKETCKPIMCSYKVVSVSFSMWGFQQKVESFTHKNIRDVLIHGHRQAFAWIDEWFNMTVDDVRDYEKKAQDRTNEKLIQENKEIIEDSGNDTTCSKNGDSPPKASNNKKGSSTRV